MPLTEQQQQFLTDNFYRTHEQEGRTQDAAQAALDVLSEIQTAHFTDHMQSEWHGEVALQAGTLWNSVAKRAGSFSQAYEALERGAKVMVEHYPLGSTLPEAVQRLDYWKPVFGEQVDASSRTFRDFLNLIDMLVVLGVGKAEQSRLEQLHLQLDRLRNQTNSESGKYILEVERGTLKEARTATGKFIVDFVKRRRTNGKEFQTVLAKFLQRSKEEKGVEYRFLSFFAPYFPKIKKLLAKISSGNSVHEMHEHLQVLRTEKQENQREFSPKILDQLLAIAYIGIGKSIYSIRRD